MKAKYKGSNNNSSFIVTENDQYYVKDSELGWGGLGDFGWFRLTEEAQDKLEKLWNDG